MGKGADSTPPIRICTGTLSPVSTLEGTSTETVWTPASACGGPVARLLPVTGAGTPPINTRKRTKAAPGALVEGALPVVGFLSRGPRPATRKLTV